MSTLAILQPSYLPWLGYLEQIHRSDHFVFYDDVQFDKNSWRNRNRIKGQSGSVWLTVPVLHKGRTGQLIKDVEIDNRQNWARKHVSTVQQAYSKAPYRNVYFNEFEEFLMRPWEKLVELDVGFIRLMCKWFGISTEFYRSSELGIFGGQSQRLLNFSQYFDAQRYLSGNSAQNYLDTGLFEKGKVEVIWQNYEHPVYQQQHGAFLPYMSALDLLLNVGPESLAILETGSTSY